MVKEISEIAEKDELDFDELPEGDGVIVINSEKRILSSNLQAERIFKRRFNPGETLRSEFIIKPQYRAKAKEVLRETLEEGHSHSNLVASVRFDNGLPISVTYSVSPLYNDSMKLTGAIFTFRDNEISINKSRHFDKLSEVEFDNLFENLAEGVFTIDRRWCITSFNKRAQEITGYKPQEVIGKNCWNIFKSDLCQMSCPLKTTLETGIMRMDQDVRITGKFGRTLSVLVNTSVLKNKHDEVLGAVETFRPLVTSEQSKKNKKSDSPSPSDIIGESKALSTVLNMLPDIAVSDASVLIEGESGTGKELIARTIHNLSRRSNGPFIPVNCSALSETLLESELFGHEKGSFTGAISSKVGRFELAREGTLFLDEIGEVKPEIQVKLLRVMEEKVFERVGGIRPISMDSRIITATNRNIQKEMNEGRFREDLFYRLRTVPLKLPPLRERNDDIPALVSYFIEEFNSRYKKNVHGLDPKAMNRLKRYHWPGNIRELHNTIEHAFVFVKGPIITLSHLPKLQEPSTSERSNENHSNGYREDELQAIIKALEKSQGKKAEASKILGISRSTLWRKIKAYGLVK